MYTVKEMEELKNKVLNMDCLEYMKRVPDNYFDLVLTDPPYGINAHKKRSDTGKNSHIKQKDYKGGEWDISIPKKEVFDEIFRISNKAIIFGGNYFIENLTNTSSFIVWDKLNGDNLYADCELAWTNFPSAVRKYEFKWHGFIQQDMSNKEERHHPTQKPVELFKMILRDYAVKNNYNKIYDAFMGSGTTALACKSLGLDFYGTELDKDYCDIIEKRLKQVQGSLF